MIIWKLIRETDAEIYQPAYFRIERAVRFPVVSEHCIHGIGASKCKGEQA